MLGGEGGWRGTKLFANSSAQLTADVAQTVALSNTVYLGPDAGP